MRLLDEQNRLSDDPLALDDLSDRSRRQLPTEINIQVTAPLFTARLYDYGTSDGDKEVPPSIDVGIKFELKQPLTFYDQKFNEIYVSTLWNRSTPAGGVWGQNSQCCLHGKGRGLWTIPNGRLGLERCILYAQTGPKK